MNADLLRRASVLVGAGVFVLVLIGQFARVDPSVSLMVSVGAGVVSGLLVFLAGAVMNLGREERVDVAPPPGPVERAAAPEETPLEGPALPGFEGLVGAASGGATPPPSGANPAAGGPDLHQTVRLDADSVDYVLPEVSPEELFREHEGIDEAFLRQGMGIEESGSASENVEGKESTQPAEGG